MIPKIIHYCWFGRAPISEDVRKYIETWRDKCPDYKIVEWNETNFNINCCTYVEEAYQHKKWAFVSDYARIQALVNYGGIYLDTDVAILKRFDPLLNLPAFCGFEDSNKLSTAVLGSVPNNELFIQWLKSYENRSFVLPDGTIDEEPNVVTFTRICKTYGLILNNKKQHIENICVVFPSEYFSPKNYATGALNATSKTIAIHYFGESWKSTKEKRIHNVEKKYINKYGESRGLRIAKIINLPLRISNALDKKGLKGEIGYYVSKIFSQRDTDEKY